MAFTRTWDETAPDGATVQASDIDLWMRYLKVDVSERFVQEHSFAEDANDGRHLPGQCGILLFETEANIDTAFTGRTEPGLAFSSDNKQLLRNNVGTRAVLDIDHGSLSGRTDDDHNIYILADGSRDFSGDQAMGDNKITGLADGTASGDALHAGQVDDATIEVDTGVIQVIDDGITEAKILAGSCTQSGSAEGTDDISNITGDFADVANLTVTFTPTGGDCLIIVSMTVTGANAGEKSSFKLLRDAVELQTWGHIAAGGVAAFETLTLMYLDTGADANSHTWKLQWKDDTGTVHQPGATHKRRISVVEFKK